MIFLLGEVNDVFAGKAKIGVIWKRDFPQEICQYILLDFRCAEKGQIFRRLKTQHVTSVSYDEDLRRELRGRWRKLDEEIGIQKRKVCERTHSARSHEAVKIRLGWQCV